jgi:hypothetical protein
MLPGDMLSAIAETADACDRGNLERAKQLLAWGVSPNAEIGGRTLLLRAASSGNHVLVKRLLRAGARPSMLALIAGVVSGNRHTVEHIADELVFSGKDPAAYTWGMILGHREFLENLTPDMARWLVKQNVDLEETDAYGRSIADLAKLWARADVVDILREAFG